MESSYLKEALSVLNTTNFAELEILKSMVLSDNIPAPMESIFNEIEEYLSEKLALEITLIRLGGLDDLDAVEKVKSMLIDGFYAQVMGAIMQKIPIPEAFRSSILKQVQKLDLGLDFFKELSNEFGQPLSDVFLSLWTLDSDALVS